MLGFYSLFSCIHNLISYVFYMLTLVFSIVQPVFQGLICILHATEEHFCYLVFIHFICFIIYYTLYPSPIHYTLYPSPTIPFHSNFTYAVPHPYPTHTPPQHSTAILSMQFYDKSCSAHLGLSFGTK